VAVLSHVSVLPFQTSPLGQLAVLGAPLLAVPPLAAKPSVPTSEKAQARRSVLLRVFPSRLMISSEKVDCHDSSFQYIYENSPTEN